MKKCGICGRSDVSLLYANHKELGYIPICQDCWVKEFADNRLASGSSTGCCG